MTKWCQIIQALIMINLSVYNNLTIEHKYVYVVPVSRRNERDLT